MSSLLLREAMSQNNISKFFFTIIIYFFCYTKVFAESLLVAVASNLSPIIGDTIIDFESEYNHSLEIVYGSTNRLYTQIRNGAPFDLFLAADETSIDSLIENNLINENDAIDFLIGTLAIYSNRPIQDLIIDEQLDPRNFNRISLANPMLAPFGRASMQHLTKQINQDLITEKIVQAQNIAQSFQYVNNGAVDLGYVSLSHILQGDINASYYWIVPANNYEPIIQSAGILSRSDKMIASKEFIEYLKSDSFKLIALKWGYQLP